LKIILKTTEVKEAAVLFEIDEEINITLFIRVTPGNGAKNSNTGRAVFFRDLVDYCLFAL